MLNLGTIKSPPSSRLRRVREVKKMIKGIESIGIFTQSAKKLAGFYKDKVGLTIEDEWVMGEKDEEMYLMGTGKGTGFFIMDHSKVKGKSKQPERIITTFEVDDIKKEVTRLKKAKVKVIADTYHIEGYGYIATFADLDGNYFQFAQTKAKK